MLYPWLVYLIKFVVTRSINVVVFWFLLIRWFLSTSLLSTRLLSTRLLSILFRLLGYAAVWLRCHSVRYRPYKKC